MTDTVTPDLTTTPVSAETAAQLREAFAAVLPGFNALCGVHAWRYYALPESFIRRDALARPNMLEGATVPRYTMKEGLHAAPWDGHALSLMQRDTSHNLFIIAHNQLFSRPLVQVLEYLVEHRDDVVPQKWKNLVRGLQRRTEVMVTGPDTIREGEAVPLREIGRVNRENLGIDNEADARYLLEQVRQVQKGLADMLALPVAKQLMGQTLEDIALYGYFTDKADPMGYLNGAAIGEYAAQRPDQVAAPDTSPAGAARQLRLMAVALRHLYSVAEPEAPVTAGEGPRFDGMGRGYDKEAPGSRFAFCAADPTRSISAIRERRTVPYDGPLRPRDAVDALERLAARWDDQPDWESVQARYGTHDYGGSRPLEAYLQAIRPLTNARTLFAHARSAGYATTAPDTLSDMLGRLIGQRPKEHAQGRAAA